MVGKPPIKVSRRFGEGVGILWIYQARRNAPIDKEKGKYAAAYRRAHKARMTCLRDGWKIWTATRKIESYVKTTATRLSAGCNASVEFLSIAQEGVIVRVMNLKSKALAVAMLSPTLEEATRTTLSMGFREVSLKSGDTRAPTPLLSQFQIEDADVEDVMRKIQM